MKTILRKKTVLDSDYKRVFEGGRSIRWAQTLEPQNLKVYTWGLHLMSSALRGSNFELRSYKCTLSNTTSFVVVTILLNPWRSVYQRPSMSFSREDSNTTFDSDDGKLVFVKSYNSFLLFWAVVVVRSPNCQHQKSLTPANG